MRGSGIPRSRFLRVLRRQWRVEACVVVCSLLLGVCKAGVYCETKSLNQALPSGCPEFVTKEDSAGINRCRHLGSCGSSSTALVVWRSFETIADVGHSDCVAF